MKIPIFARQKQAWLERKAQPDVPSAKRISPNEVILRTTLAGILFGFLFPILSSLMMIARTQLPVTLWSLILVQRNNPLLWVIDTAPIFLGLFAYFVGRNHAAALELNEELKASLDERSQLVSQLETLSASLEQVVEKRVNQLKTAAQVAQEANAIRDMKQLLAQTAGLISERFGYYHVGIYLHDLKGEFT